MSLKPGDCLQTTDGRRLIASVKKFPLSASKGTYTVVAEGDGELIVVGGVMAHVLSKIEALNKLRGTTQKNSETLHAGVARIMGRYKKSQAQRGNSPNKKPRRAGGHWACDACSYVGGEIGGWKRER